MSDDSAYSRANRIRRNRIEAIKAGALPTVENLFDGMPFFRESSELDYQAWSRDLVEELASVRDDGQFVRDIERAARKFNLANVQRVSKSAERLHEGPEVTQRLMWYRCALGDAEARGRLSAIALAHAGFDSVAGPYALAVALGLALSLKLPETALREGEKRLQIIDRNRERLIAAVADDEDESALQAVLDDRAELDPDADRDDTSIHELVAAIQRAQRKMLVVVPALPNAGKSHKGEIYKLWTGIAGTALPLVRRPDLVEARAKLEARGQHTAGAVDVMLRDLAASEVVRFRPTILLGSAGAGKSALAMAMAEAVGVPARLISLAGASDSAVGGTSAQWHSARESPVLQLVREKKVAKPPDLFARSLT